MLAAMSMFGINEFSILWQLKFIFVQTISLVPEQQHGCCMHPYIWNTNYSKVYLTFDILYILYISEIGQFINKTYSGLSVLSGTCFFG